MYRSLPEGIIDRLSAALKGLGIQPLSVKTRGNQAYIEVRDNEGNEGLFSLTRSAKFEGWLAPTVGYTPPFVRDHGLDDPHAFDDEWMEWFMRSGYKQALLAVVQTWAAEAGYGTGM